MDLVYVINALEVTVVKQSFHMLSFLLLTWQNCITIF